MNGSAEARYFNLYLRAVLYYVILGDDANHHLSSHLALLTWLAL